MNQDILDSVQNIIVTVQEHGLGPEYLADRVGSFFVELLREQGKDWQSSDLMDAAAWIEGTL